MTNKKLNVWLPFLFAVVLIAGMMAGYSIRTNFRLSVTADKSAPLNEAWSLIRHRYVDEVNLDTVGIAAIEEMLKKLDPHSRYIPAGELQAVNEDLEGRFQGIGIEFSMINDTLNVIYVIKDGPADKAGLLVGDKILTANDSLLTRKSITQDYIRKNLRGPSGSDVSVDILRDGQKIKKTITRGYIAIPSIDAAYMMDNTTGYIRLNKFSETTYDEFLKAMGKLNDKGMKGLILDLRDNGGGVLDAAVNIADDFLDGTKLITYTEGKHLPRKDYKALKPGVFETGKLVILVDETSASASEVLSGALQDWDRATIVGRRTFGKGLVQEQYDLTDGSALRLTVARYYTPTGRCIQKPYTGGAEAYEEELLNRYHSAQISNADSNRHPTGKLYQTLVKKRNVYGGGGITPDVFIPLDTTIRNDAFGKLYRKYTMGNFVYDYYTHNKNLFTSFKTPSDLFNGFPVDEKLWAQFSDFSKKDSVDLSLLNPKEIDYLKHMLQSSFARQIWRIEGMTIINNMYDDEVKKALEVINKP